MQRLRPFHIFCKAYLRKAAMRSASGLPETLFLLIHPTLKSSSTLYAMKPSFTDRLKELFNLGKRYLLLQVDCIRMSTAEKLALLLSGMALALIAILFGALMVVLLAMACVCVFGTFLAPWLAYLCVAGIILLLLLLLYIFRKPLIINPVTRFVTKIIYPKEK